MQLIFISDLHLSPDTMENNQIFYDLIAIWRHEVDAIYILGDFFDSWLGDDDSNPFIETMKAKLAEFTKIKPIYYITGNHDFALGNKFARDTGVKILKDCSVISVANNQILLSHGDVFCTLDIQYQRMKKILQNPIVLTLLKLLPLIFRRKLKDMLEHKSAGSLNTKPQSTYYIVDDAVLKVANKKFANVVIHGHTHKPGKYIIKNMDNIPDSILRVEIPDWSDHKGGGYVLIKDNDIMVHHVN
jgi:UDP-2,3-diacylglucosamine hydrolase